MLDYQLRTYLHKPPTKKLEEAPENVEKILEEKGF